jgi:hypothetical protein
MPNVEFRYVPSLAGSGTIAGKKQLAIENNVAAFVADNMNCRDYDGKLIAYDWKTQIDIVVFEPIGGRANKQVIMSVTAHDYPERMDNIKDRLEAIAEQVRDYLALPPNTVSVGFNPQPKGCWAKA